MSLPVVDLTPFATGEPLPTPAAVSIASRLDRDLCDVGFFTVVGHGVPDSLRRAYFEAMRTFFALPVADKEAISIGRSTCHRGYVGVGAESLDGAIGGDEDAIGTASAGDLKESLDTGIEHPPDHPEVVAGTPLFGPNQLPDIPGFRDVLDAYRSAATETVRRVQRVLALGLGLPPQFFEDLPGENMYHLRLVRYPALPDRPTEPGRWGCGAHTDYGSVTVLATDGTAGLQVRRRDGVWIDVDPPADRFVVNLGDLMTIWTNDRWMSNPHRVVNPLGADRYSSALFVEPDFHARVETLPSCRSADGSSRHAPVTVGPYLLSRFDGTHAYRTVS